MSRVLMIVAAVLAFVSVVSHIVAGNRHRNRVYIMAIDRSGSTDAIRADQLRDFTRMRKAALAENATLEMWYYDNVATCALPAGIPTDREKIRRIKSDFLIPNPGQPHIGTRPEMVLRKFADEAPELAGKDVRIAIFTDGDNDYPVDATRIQDDASLLAKLKRVKLAVFGIHAENDQWWQRLVGGQLGSNLILAPSSEHDNALRRLIGD